MNFTAEQLQKIHDAEDPGGLLALAEAEGIPMTEAEARAHFARLHPPAGELADDELEAVSGGGCGGGGGGGKRPTRFRVRGYQFKPCPRCGYNYWADTKRSYTSETISGWKTTFCLECAVCRHHADEGAGGEVPELSLGYDFTKIDQPTEGWIDE